MKLRLIPVSLACTALVGGLATASAQANTTAAKQVNQPAATKQGPPGVAPGGSALNAPSSTAALAGAITGVVAGSGSGPLAGACVIASGPSGQAMAMTRPDGRYSLNPLRPGAYTLHFSDCSNPGRYLDQWSGGGFVPTGASSVVVSGGRVKYAGRVTLRSAESVVAGTAAAPIPGIAPGALPGPGSAPWSRAAQAGTSALTATTGAIAGRVTGKGKPLAGICVFAYPRRGGRGANVRTSTTGRYRLGSLKPAKYIVGFYDCTNKTNWLGQYYRDVPFYSSRQRPTPVPVVAGKTTSGINAALQLGGEIHGTIRNKAGQPLARICAEAIGRVGQRFVFGGFARSGRKGRYALHALAPASYQVFFSRCGNTGNYAPMWWKHSFTMAHATKIVIKSGTIAGHISPVMPKGAVISGTVRAVGPTGRRLRGICVFAEGRTSFALSITDKNGNYRLIGLTTGKYRLFYLRCRNRGNYLSVQRQVKITLGHTISGFDVFLPLGAIVRGVVTDGHGNAVAGICVEVEGRHGFGGARTGRDGSYSINAMRSGSYKVRFSGGCGNAGSYAPQFYHGEANIASADRVELTAGQTTSRISAAMRPGATITGTVTDSAGNRLSRVCISLIPVSGLQSPFFFFGNLAFTENGAYVAANLTPGLYAVSFGCFFGTGTLARQWFMAQSAQSAANLVSAPAGVVTSGVNAELQQSGSISGTVTNRLGKPLARICVEASSPGAPTPTFFFGPGFALTTKNGSYVMRGMAPGSYVLHFVDCLHRTYGSRWYQHKASPQSATPVSVTPGGTTTGIDETLARGGSISGLVRDSSGAPLPGACVDAIDATTQSVGFGRADSTGHYTIPALSTGSYQLTFFPCIRSKPRLAASVRPGLVAVQAPNAVTGINGKLGIAGSIMGTARDSAGKLQAGVCAVAVPADPGNSIATGTTGPHGIYDVRGIGAGTYHVYIGDPFCGGRGQGQVFAPQWYKNQPSEATATDVTVTAGASTTGISAKLAAGGTISGKVSHQSQPVAGECVTAFPVNAAPDPLFGQTLHPVIAVTATDGSYSLIGLLPGQYHVKFSIGCGDSGFATLWWKQATSEQSASIVTVTANGVVTGIDASLP
jgi:hypothetical protein